jgi:alpha-L-arabinofuranosidase
MKKQLILIFLVFPICLLAQENTVFTVQVNKPIAPISATMWGLFFEDINLGADGGLYAELVKNRSFEFSTPMMGWKILSNHDMMYGYYFGSSIEILNRTDKSSPNQHFLHLTLKDTRKDSLGLVNEGFRGMGIKKGLRYDFSVLYRSKNKRTKLYVELISEKDSIIGSGVYVPELSDGNWQKGEMSFMATATDLKAKLRLWFEGDGVLDLDMISLFPSDTWKGRKGGLRADLVQMMADMKPGFLRFPGGCIVEGRDLAQRYQWKNSIGPLEERPFIINRWNNEMKTRPTPDYFQSQGLGFFEYFQLCEDIGAEPLPILNCGMACQVNSAELAAMDGLGPFVQDALDLIEFANGGPETTWGKLRVAMGHPAPFHLKMIGIGNENFGDAYLERYKLFSDVVGKRYPEIKLVGSTGLLSSGELFDKTNKELRNLKAAFVDEHNYSSAPWFFQNANHYDGYDRKSATKVFVGEYAAQSIGITNINNQNNWLMALSEAAYMTGLERNAAVVQMTSYAPLFAHVDGWQWKPDLIWFDNLRVMATPNYYVQKLFATNKGHVELPMLYSNQVPAMGHDSLYATASMDTVTHELILKMVNASPKEQSISVRLDGIRKIAAQMELITLQNDDLNAENELGSPARVAPFQSVIPMKKNQINFTLKRYSFVVARVKL